MIGRRIFSLEKVCRSIIGRRQNWICDSGINNELISVKTAQFGVAGVGTGPTLLWLPSLTLWYPSRQPWLRPGWEGVGVILIYREVLCRLQLKGCICSLHDWADTSPLAVPRGLLGGPQVVARLPAAACPFVRSAVRRCALATQTRHGRPRLPSLPYMFFPG